MSCAAEAHKGDACEASRARSDRPHLRHIHVCCPHTVKAPLVRTPVTDDVEARRRRLHATSTQRKTQFSLTPRGRRVQPTMPQRILVVVSSSPTPSARALPLVLASMAEITPPTHPVAPPIRP